MHAVADMQGFLRWPTERSRLWLSSFVDFASRHPAITAVVAIGSGVRSNVPSNDLDLVVVTRGKPVPLSDVPIEVDIRQYAEGEVQDKILAGHDLLGWAIKFGVPLFERNHYWTALAQKHRDSLPLPSAELAMQRAEKSRQILLSCLEMGDEDAVQEQLVSYLTHLGRAALIEAGVFPASRPEIPRQLQEIGSRALADELQQALSGDASARYVLDRSCRRKAV